MARSIGVCKSVMDAIKNESFEKSSTNVIDTCHNHGSILPTMESGDRIKSTRLELGWSQKRLAGEVGCSQPAIKKIERGETLRSRLLPKIARVLNIKLSDLDPDIALQETAAGLILPRVDLVGESDLPVYATVVATTGEADVAISGHAIEHVGMPAPLAKVRGAYGIQVSGETMVPEFWPGDVVLVHPHMSITSGSTYLFFAADDASRATIRHLVRVTDKDWIVKIWNPVGSPEAKLSRAEFPKAHRTVGRFSRR